MKNFKNQNKSMSLIDDPFEEDIVADVFSNILNLSIPHFGGVIKSLIDSASQVRHKKRLKEFLECLNDDLYNKISKLEYEKPSTDEFLDVSESTSRQLLRTSNDSKRKALKNLLFHSITNCHLNIDETIGFKNLINELTANHFEVLIKLTTYPMPERENSKTLEEFVSETINSLKITGDKFWEIHQDLENNNLARGIDGDYSTRTQIDKDGNPFANGGAVLGDLDSYVTDKGLRFLKYIDAEG